MLIKFKKIQNLVHMMLVHQSIISPTDTPTLKHPLALPSLKLTSSPLKMDAWNTIRLPFWVTVAYFNRGANVKLQSECRSVVL